MSPPIRILWASPNTLLDTANGAGLMVRECLNQLALRGCDVAAIGATVFVNPQGMASRAELWPRLLAQKGRFVEVPDGLLRHRLLVTERSQRRLMLSFEEQRWFDEYCRLLDADSPDLVLFFDNSLITLLTANEAHRRNIAVGVFLMHGNNRGTTWCRDVDFIFTDTRATAEMYRQREGYHMIPLGTFVDPAPVTANAHRRERVLFINPIPAKGGVFVAQLILHMAQRRPDIPFEVVDTRATWLALLESVASQTGIDPDEVRNVLLTPNTRDMRPVYGRARVLLAPSLWWDSGPRVVVEALLNGIPVIGSTSGGIPEILGEGGETIAFPPEYQEAPYLRLVPQEIVEHVSQRLEELFDDEAVYGRHVDRARGAGRKLHDLQSNGDRLMERVQHCLADHRRAP